MNALLEKYSELLEENAALGSQLDPYDAGTYWLYLNLFIPGGFDDYAYGIPDSDPQSVELHWLGNVNYGVMMAAAGFNEDVALALAGAARQAGGRYPEKGQGTPGLSYPYGDTPAAARYIQLGYAYYRTHLRTKRQ